MLVNMEARDFLRGAAAHAAPTHFLQKVRERVSELGLEAKVLAFSAAVEARLAPGPAIGQRGDGAGGAGRGAGGAGGVGNREAYFEANPTHTSARRSILAAAFSALKLVGVLNHS